jgi:hypothetical protein
MPSAIRMPLTGAAILGFFFLLFQFGSNTLHAVYNVVEGLPSTPLEYICLGIAVIGVLYIVGAIAEAGDRS